MTLAGPGLRRHVAASGVRWALSLVALLVGLPMVVFSGPDGLRDLYRDAAARAQAFRSGPPPQELPPWFSPQGSEELRWLANASSVDGRSTPLATNGVHAFFAVEIENTWEVRRTDGDTWQTLARFPSGPDVVAATRITGATAFVDAGGTVTVVGDDGRIRTAVAPAVALPRSRVSAGAAIGSRVYVAYERSGAIAELDFSSEPAGSRMIPVVSTNPVTSMRAVDLTTLLLVTGRLWLLDVLSGNIKPLGATTGFGVAATGRMLLWTVDGLVAIDWDGTTKLVVPKVFGPAASGHGVIAGQSGDSHLVVVDGDGEIRLELPMADPLAASDPLRYAGVQSVVVLDSGTVVFSTKEFGLVGAYQ